MKKTILSFFSFVFMFSLYSQCIQGNWSVPYFEGNTLNDVEILDPQTAMIVGNYGTMIKTTDQGLSWYHIEHKTLQSLNFIDFIGSTGYACGEYGCFMKSLDEGEIWTKMELPIYNFHVEDMEMVSENTVFLIGDRYYGLWYEERYILATFDGGATWDTTNMGLGNLYSHTIFLDQDKGILVGNLPQNSQLTTDGGTTWTNLSLEIIPQIFVTDSLAYGGDIGGKFLFNIYTLDTVEILNTAMVPNGVDQYEKFYFKGVDSVWTICETSSGQLIGVPRTFSGVSAVWEKVPSIGVIGVNYTDIDFEGDFGIVIGKQANIVTTKNNGATWQTFLSGYNYPPQVTQKKKITFVNDVVGYTGGKYGKLFKTSDGGKRWTELPLPSYKFDIVDIQFLNENVGFVIGALNYAGGNNNFFSTTDGGLTWQSYHINSSSLLTKVFFLNDTLGWVGNEQGRVFRTTNGGASWTTHLLPAVVNVDYLFFTSSTNGYCENWRTTNGGTSWTNLVGANNATAAYFFNDTTGFIATNGQIRKTTNGLNFVGIPGTGAGNSIRFNNNNGICVGNLGMILVTTDYGVTWQNKSLSLSSYEYKFQSCDVTPNGNLHMITYEWLGSEPDYYKSTNGGNTILSPHNGAHTAINDIDVANDSTYYYTTNWDVYKTNNYGESWNSTSINFNSTTNFNLIGFHGKVDTAYLDFGVLNITNNAGRTFTPSTIIGRPKELFSFPSTTKMVINTVSTTKYSLNNGATWTNSNIPVNYNYDLQCFDSQVCYIRHDTQGYKSTDGGITWNICWLSNLKDIDFLNQDTGFVVKEGLRDSLFLTINGGVSWINTGITLDVSIPQNIEYFTPYDINNGYVLIWDKMKDCDLVFKKLYKVKIDVDSMIPIDIPAFVTDFQLIGYDSLMVVIDGLELMVAYSDTVLPAPHVSLMYTTDSLCVSGDATVYCNAENMGMYPTFQWLVNGDTISTGTNGYITLTGLDTTVNITALVHGTSVCFADQAISDTAVITILEPEMPAINMTYTTDSICINGSSTVHCLTDNMGMFPTFQWLVNGDTVDTGTNGYITLSGMDTTVSITVLVHSTNICFADQVFSDTIIITFFDLGMPTISLVNTTDSLCVNGSATVYCLTENMGMFPTFQWLVNGDTIDTDTNEYITLVGMDTTVSITALVNGTNACFADQMISDTVMITIVDPGMPTITINPPVLHCQQTGVTYHWFENGIPIGMDTCDINYTSGNLYQLVLETNGCFSDTASIITTTGIEGNISYTNMTLYPNPSSKDLIVSVISNEPSSSILKIISATGVLLLTRQVEILAGYAINIPIDVSSFAPGLYFAEIYTNKSIVVKSFIKK
jgi:photosystem II stability/assembly factor-like uncharacterized protein